MNLRLGYSYLQVTSCNLGYVQLILDDNCNESPNVVI